MDHAGWDQVLTDAAGHPELHDRWIQGLAHNSAAPAAVIRRIITVQDRLTYPRIWLTLINVSTETFADLATHPDAAIRRAMAQNEHTDIETLAMLAADSEPGVSYIAVVMANDRGLTFPAPLMAQLEADDASHRIRAEAQRQALRLSAASEPASTKPGSAPPPKPPVPELPTAEAESLITSTDPGTRADAAWNPQVPHALALRLADDPDDAVRLRLSLREDLCDEERQAIAYIVPDGYHESPPWIRDLQDDAEALIRLAVSPHVLIRRSVARFRHLPAKAVALLAEDEDFFVKLTLCQNCAEAPHELVIEMYAWWHGKTSWFLTFHPNFDRPGFAKYSTHVHERLRHLALRDPDLSVDEVARLSTDPHLRSAALRDARMPKADLQAALLDGTRALAAAGNPTLPDTVMHTLLDIAGVPDDPIAHPPTGKTPGSTPDGRSRS